MMTLIHSFDARPCVELVDQPHVLCALGTILLLAKHVTQKVRGLRPFQIFNRSFARQPEKAVHTGARKQRVDYITLNRVHVCIDRV